MVFAFFDFVSLNRPCGKVELGELLSHEWLLSNSCFSRPTKIDNTFGAACNGRGMGMLLSDSDCLISTNFYTVHLSFSENFIFFQTYQMKMVNVRLRIIAAGTCIVNCYRFSKRINVWLCCIQLHV